MKNRTKKAMEYQSILVPVSGTATDEEAIKLACRLARQDKAKICAVNVIPIQRTLPLDAEMVDEVQKAEEILDRVESVARGQNYSIETDLLVEFILDFTEKFLNDILQCDQSRRSSIFIHNDDHPHSFLLHLFQEIGNHSSFWDKNNLPQDLSHSTRLFK